MLRSLLAAFVVFAACVANAADPYKAGEHYALVTPPVATSSEDGRVEVVELFWYGCPHCYAFEPSIESWLKDKPEYVDFVRVPAVFAANWEIHARAFYATEQLGVTDQTHHALFKALHVDKRKLFSLDALAAFFAEQGVDEADFRKAYDSFDVDNKTRQAVQVTRKYGISGVPAVIVNGKYRSSAKRVGNYTELLKLVDFLAAKESGQ